MLTLVLVITLTGVALPLFQLIDHTLFSALWELPANGNSLTVPFPGAGFQAYLHQHQVIQPIWIAPAINAALIAILALLTLGVPALGTLRSIMVVILLAAALMVSQAYLLLYRQTWLPLGQVLTLLVPGFLIMLFWLQPHREILSLRRNVAEARFQLGKLLLQHGQADAALLALANCPPSADTLGLQYDIAIQQERKRQYDAAVRTYHQIMSHKKGFRDVKNRLQTLEKINAESAGLNPQTAFDGAGTLVLPDNAVTRPTLGRYEIERELGRGAMGVVYLGKDPRIARRVAIKTFSYAQFDGAELSELKTRFSREAEAAGRLSHPAIVTVYDVGEEADLAFIAMDFAPGKPLSAFGRTGSLLPLPVVLDIIARVADALDYAHKQKIVHRDIKPGNVIYDPKTGSVKITDFGIAKIADDSRTRTGNVMGSPLYMSPEQLKGQKVSGASDTYSLGITLYKLVSGEVPYNADTLANLTYQILNKRPRSIRELNPELPDGVVRLINKAIQKDPAKRFASASAMAEALRRIAARSGTQQEKRKEHS
ncbi:serine/threonine-protein kinase [Marinobacter sp. 1Y8]